MKTDAVTAADLGRSVIAVPPLAYEASGKVSVSENRKIVEHLAGGGVSSFLYGGNDITPCDMAALIANGVVCSVKYAVERKDPADDRYLAALVDACGTSHLVSGIGERPVIVHWTKFGIHAFTSGSVSIAPNGRWWPCHHEPFGIL